MAKCILPPELDDKKLLEFLDDLPDSETASHLERCPYCREKADALALLQNRLGARLSRITCPSSTELGEYHLSKLWLELRETHIGMLSPLQMLTITAHLRECPHCTREVAELGQFLGTEKPMSETGIVDKIQLLVARLVGGVSNAGSAGLDQISPGFASLRGENDGPVIYQANHIQISIDIRDDTEKPGRKVLLGLVTGLESGGFTIQARLEGEIVATSPIDEIGNFFIPLLIPGLYELTLIGASIEVRIQSLPV